MPDAAVPDDVRAGHVAGQSVHSQGRNGVRSLVRLSIGLVLLVAALWAAVHRLDAIWNGHPAYPTTLLVTAGAGLS